MKHCVDDSNMMTNLFSFEFLNLKCQWEKNLHLVFVSERVLVLVSYG